jgi:hypothetical protein
MSLQEGVIVSTKVTNLATSQLLGLRISISVGLRTGDFGDFIGKSQRIYLRSRTNWEKIILFCGSLPT